jgi:hypothetical protein
MNSHLHLIKDSIEEIILYLRKNHTLEEVPQYPNNKIFLEADSAKLIENTQKSFGGFLSKIQIWNTIEEKLPKSKHAIKEILKSVNLEEIYVQYGQDQKTPLIEYFRTPKFYFEVTLRPFINNYFLNVNTFEFKKSVVEEMYTEWKLQKESTEIEEIAVVPLYGFKMQFDTLHIHNDTIIEKLNDFDYQYIFDFQDSPILPPSQKLELHDFIETRFKLSIRYKYRKEEDPKLSRFNIHNQLKNVVIALRLLKKGTFFPMSIFTSTYPAKRKFYFDNWFHHQDTFEINVFRSPIQRFELHQEDLPELRTLLNIINDEKLIEELESIQVGLNKFNDTFSKSTFEEQVLSLATALDSTALYNDNNSNFYKLRVRCSYMAGGKVEFNVFKFCDYLISRRNDIIHKGQHLSKSLKEGKLVIDNRYYSIQDFIELSTQLTRVVLREYLKRIKKNCNVGAINAELETKHLR